MKRLVFILMLLASPAFAAVIDTPLSDPAQESRAQALFHQLRCVVCESASVADSPSEIATDMRRTVREKVAAGENTDAIIEWLVARYGEHVLMSPPVESHPLLWFAPLLMLLAGGVGVFLYFRRSKS